MKKWLYLFLLAILVLPSVMAIDVEVEKVSSDEVMILDLKLPTDFEISLKNNGVSDNFKFYNLLGFVLEPSTPVYVMKGQEKKIALQIFPRSDFKNDGYYTLQYHIKGQDGTEVIEKVMMHMVYLKDAFEIGAGEIDPESNSLKVYIRNKENFNFGSVNVHFSSVFFDFEESFELGPNERKEFDVELNHDDFRKLMAGFYTMEADIVVEDKDVGVEGTIKFVEKDILTSTKKEFGLIINTNIVEKTNEGNVLATSETVIKKNIISRLFTTFSPEPDSVVREGSVTYYSWANEIKPGETVKIYVRTNWLFPFLIVFFVVVIVALVRKYSERDISVRKKVSFVRAKGGEFALKVTLYVTAKRYVEQVNIIDRLPGLTKLYERFGGERPTRVDEKNRRIEWNFQKLEVGERRTLAYVIYSKVGIMGKFALPSAVVIYQKDGKIKEKESNRAFFVAEQRSKDLVDLE